MRIWRMTRVVSAAPGGASMPGTAMVGPPGCASGTAGGSNRSRSRPGWSLGGTSCAPDGTTCAMAANETLTIAKAAAMARTHASMPPTLDERTEFYAMARQPAPSIVLFRQFFQMFQKGHTASRDAAGSWLPRPRRFGRRAHKNLVLQNNVVCYVLTLAAVSKGKQFVLFSAEGG